MADPALILLRFPVELVGPNGGELVGRAEAEVEGQEGVEEFEVEKVP